MFAALRRASSGEPLAITRGFGSVTELLFDISGVDGQTGGGGIEGVFCVRVRVWVLVAQPAVISKWLSNLWQD